MAKVSQKSVRLSITGMHCGNCVASVEKKFQETPGVLSVVVNLASNSAIVAYDSKVISENDLVHVLDPTSFSASILIDVFDTFSENTKAKHNKKLKVDLVKLIISIVLTLFVLTLHYFAGHSITVNLVMLTLTIPVQFYCGWDFLVGGAKSIINKSPNMDLLVAAGTLITFIYSIYICVVGGKPFFETSCMLISFISFGEYIENRAKNQTNKAVEDLVNLVPNTTDVINWEDSENSLINAFKKDENFKFISKQRNDVAPGDYLIIKEGQSVSADCQIISGQAKLNESMLTGESEMIDKNVGDDITGGTVVYKGNILVKVARSNADSVLSRIVRAVMDAQSSKAPVARFADKIAGVFVPIVLGIAIITFLAWFIFYDANFSEKLQQSLMCAVSILTVACPCALVLATPITLTVAMGRAAQLGIIIRDGVVLETMPKIKNVIFDKTGTLTQSNLDKNEKAAKKLRPDAAQTINILQNDLSIETFMLSGDTESEAFRIADKIGIKRQNVVAGADPISKKDYLLNLMNSIKNKNQDAGAFGYVGDGINDAPAMAASDVGITLESATDIALESGNVVLMHNKLLDLILAIRLSKASMRKIKQNLFWALCYNIVLIPLAAFGFIIPIWCGAIHAISSLLVVFNSLLLKGFK